MIRASSNTLLHSYAIAVKSGAMTKPSAYSDDLVANALTNYNDNYVAVNAWIASVAGAPFWEGQ
jgi:hypothetical protein